ncbi:hypothetical protein [Candidatus Bathycorpusculum sp.]|uniref:hypothetical protein n=1 Tax=Candidatus Bathycorpusculum sp. TaxID=2994959 RepID=UPI002822172E|nr:hypothetical protein [Candidatus Termitimicrobium sp.]MCL2432589.1 hypothetical protein [Candidatus Termitimicrobium sp.]
MHFVSLLFVVALVFPFVSVSASSSFVLDASDQAVSNWFELRDAVTNAEGHTVISLNKDITIDQSLDIPANKNITLTSSSKTTFFKLIATTSHGTSSCNTITVEDGGVLTLDGIIVTHADDVWNWGVVVESGGTLTLLDGEISGNKQHYGVINSGSFVMSGGVIANNGGGVYVNNGGWFTMFDGVIANNTAGRGSGVTVFGGSFSMFGGVIANNTALAEGGGVYLYSGSFVMSGGVIANNTARDGGGVYVSSDGRYGGGSSFVMLRGMISSNVASCNGGGVWVTDTTTDLGRFIIPKDAMVVFSDNRAVATYDRHSVHNKAYDTHIAGKVTWSSFFTQGYNNFDISYTRGIQSIDGYIMFIVVISTVLAVGIVSIFLWLKIKRQKLFYRKTLNTQGVKHE